LSRGGVTKNFEAVLRVILVIANLPYVMSPYPGVVCGERDLLELMLKFLRKRGG
jgi:hypothetical protein